ncbi:helicase-associated domain-containing protein [Candidatus Sumerlaeota bacterium]|nr:helicase-associated domain-containing protein [Candidatus Sumerlaeota bacterium]
MNSSTLPIIVQSDNTVLLETASPQFEMARDALAGFAELVKSPDHYHTYRITPLSLWNAASAGLSADQIIDELKTYSKYDIPQNVLIDIAEYVGRYGRLKLLPSGTNGELVLTSEDAPLIAEIAHHQAMKSLIRKKIDRTSLQIKSGSRGAVKLALIKIGFPVEDLAGYDDGAPLDIGLRETTTQDRPFALRLYQQQAVDAYHARGAASGGSGVLVLPCGAGKTIIGIGAMNLIGQHTLILSTNIVALRQWRQELIDKTRVDPEAIGEYSGEQKQIRPITLTTYQILTYRKRKSDDFVHMELFQKGNWGLIIYDEVHLLPAPVFRAVADLQARRRLGLTATLVREDGKEDDVFSLIGPKKYDLPWKVLERQGWIAQAICTEIRVGLPQDRRMPYAMADRKAKYRIASENPVKMQWIERLIERHKNDNILIIGQYIDQLEEIQKRFGAPIITGKTPVKERETIYRDFRDGTLKCIIVSKVANFSIDLPDANVVVQVSGTFGSRQEEAQRLGRVLRPKSGDNQAHFYSLVTRETKDQDFAAKRQLFLTEQGYRYNIEIGDEPVAESVQVEEEASVG